METREAGTRRHYLTGGVHVSIFLLRRTPTPPPPLLLSLGCHQMYVRLGELPLYLSHSRTGSEGGFKRIKEGCFKAQPMSPQVQEVRQRFTATTLKAFSTISSKLFLNGHGYDCIGPRHMKCSGRG